MIGSWEAALYSPTVQDDSPTGRVAKATNRVVEAIRSIGQPVPFNVLCVSIGMSKTDVKTAIDAAVDEGLITDEKVGNRRMLSLPEWS